MFIFNSDNTVKLLLFWGVIVMFKILLRKHKSLKFLDLMVGVSSLILLINLAYVLLDNTSTSFVSCLLAFILGLLLVSVFKLVKHKSKVNMLNIRGIIVYLCLSIPLVVVLGYSYVNNIHYHDYIKRSASSVQVSSPMTSTERVKADIKLIMGMYDDNSYQKAKSSIAYGQKVKDIYFKSAKWNTYTEYKTNPDIVIQSLGVDLNETKDKTYNYYAIVNIPFVKDGKRQEHSIFLVTAKYQNDELIDFTRRRVN